MSWSLWVVETVSGRIVAELGMSRLAWNIRLGEVGSLQATAPVEQVEPHEGYWGDRDPRVVLRGIAGSGWKLSLVAVFGRQPIVGGPIISPRPGAAEVEFACAGIAKVLQRRVVRNPYNENGIDHADAAITLTEQSLPRLAYNLVGYAVLHGDGYELPISWPTIPPAGDHQRTYHAYDLASTWERLTELSEVEGGPDVRFDPYLDRSVEPARVQWRLHIGDPELGDRSHPAMWDLGANCVSIVPDIDASELSTTVFAAGSGQEADKLLTTATNDTLVDHGWPALETVDTEHLSVSEQDTLASHATEHLRAYRRPLSSWTATVRADVEPLLGTYWPGDWARIDVRGHPFIPDGVHTRRILGMSGDSSTEVQLELSDDIWEVA